jgi:hypothetical protein
VRHGSFAWFRLSESFADGPLSLFFFV